MSCRETSTGRAMTRIARETSGLTDSQVASLVHECKRTFVREHGRPRTATRAERDTLAQYLTNQRTRVAGAYLPLGQATQRRVLANLDNAIDLARNGELTNADVYMWTHVEEEAVRAQNAVELFLVSQSAASSEPYSEWEAAYHEALAASGRSGRGRPSNEDTIDLNEFGDLSGMVEQTPGDFRTRSALLRLAQYGVQRCPSCGRFMAAAGGDHGCPSIEPASPYRAGTAPLWPRAEDAEEVLSAPASEQVEAPASPSRINNRVYSNADRSMTIRMPSASGLRRAMLSEPGQDRLIAIDAGTQTEQITGTLGLRVHQIPATRGGEEIPGREGRWRQEILTSSEDLRCSCPDYRANYDCVHVREVINEVHSLLDGRSRRPATPPAEAVANARAILADEYTASQSALNYAPSDVAPRTATPTTAGEYLDDPAGFLTVADSARERAEAGDYTLPYMTENALGPSSAPGGPRTFGLELEIDFPDEDPDNMGESKARLAQALEEAGLSRFGTALPWHYMGRDEDTRGRRMGGDYSADPDTWSVEFDRSVDPYSGRRGCEVKSPIMNDSPETWRNLQTVCRLIQQHGGQVTMRTGLHVNVGTGDFDHTVGHYNRIAQITNAYDDVLVRMSSSPEKGTSVHRGRDYCLPIVAPSEGFASITELQMAQGDDSDERHRRAVNFAHAPREGRSVRNSTRVEMRLFDGSVDPGRIQAAIRLSVGIVDAAAAGREPGMEPERGGTHLLRARLGNNVSPEADSESTRRLIDLIEQNPAGKEQLAQLWGQAVWALR